jgi:hypothetical protein
MVQGSDCASLALESFAPDWIGCELLRQNLDRDGTIQTSVERLEHLAHAAGAKRPEQLVRTESGSGGQLQRCAPPRGMPNEIALLRAALKGERRVMTRDILQRIEPKIRASRHLLAVRATASFTGPNSVFVAICSGST